MKNYIYITFTKMKLFWFFILAISIGAIIMKYYFTDDTTALVMVTLATFMSVVNLIGSYVYMEKNNLW